MPLIGHTPSPKPFLGRLIKRGIQLRNKINPGNISASELQLKTLQELLQHAEQTAFGGQYGFRRILGSSRPMRTFREVVPVHDYNALHDQWWHRALAGEQDVCWPGKVKYFALSSGTSGAPSKYIPVTDDMMRAMRKASLEMFLGIAEIPEVDPSVYTRQMLMLGSTIDLRKEGDCYVGDLSGINAGRIPVWFRRYYRPGFKIARIADWDARIEAIAAEAHRWDVGVISGIPAWIQLMMERVIQRNGLSNIHEIWPNLSVYASGGVAFEPYRKGFEKILGKPLVYLDTYLASEGFVAFQTRTDTHAMELLLGNGIYYEFVPFNDDHFSPDGEIRPDAVALTLDEVEEGVDYALLMSTCSGAWRYLLGDTVRFTDLERCELVITGRTKHFLSVTGEHLSVDNMNSAIQHLEETFEIEIREFTVAGIPHQNLFAHQWYIGVDRPVDSAELARQLDQKLRELNADYDTERRENALRDVRVRAVPSQLFYEWQRSQGKMGGQSKFPRVMGREKFADWEAFVDALVRDGRKEQKS
jgi:hypothetical protein